MISESFLNSEQNQSKPYNKDNFNTRKMLKIHNQAIYAFQLAHEIQNNSNTTKYSIKFTFTRSSTESEIAPSATVSSNRPTKNCRRWRSFIGIEFRRIIFSIHLMYSDFVCNCRLSLIGWLLMACCRDAGRRCCCSSRKTSATRIFSLYRAWRPVRLHSRTFIIFVIH